jgi:addiction module HigA family antidote
MPKKTVTPIHPGEVLQTEFLEPMGITQYRLAKSLQVSPRRINEIVHGKRSISADTALRLSRHFGTSERFWMNLQARYDIDPEGYARGQAREGSRRPPGVVPGATVEQAVGAAAGLALDRGPACHGQEGRPVIRPHSSIAR